MKVIAYRRNLHELILRHGKRATMMLCLAFRSAVGPAQQLGPVGRTCSSVRFRNDRLSCFFCHWRSITFFILVGFRDGMQDCEEGMMMSFVLVAAARVLVGVVVLDGDRLDHQRRRVGRSALLVRRQDEDHGKKMNLLVDDEEAISSVCEKKIVRMR